MFCVSRIFCQNTIFGLRPRFRARRRAVFRDFPGKRGFQNSGRCEKNPVFACVLVSPGFFCQNTIFDLTPFFALSIGRFPGFSWKTWFSKFGPMQKNTMYLHVFWCLRVFFSKHDFRLDPCFCARRRAGFRRQSKGSIPIYSLLADGHTVSNAPDLF